MYEYNCKVNRIIDGDSVVLEVDMGFDCIHILNCRLFGIDAPEIRGKDLTDEQRELGRKSTEYLQHLLAYYEPLRVHTHKLRTGKYGRYLADIFGGSNFRVHINELMVRDGHAEYYAKTHPMGYQDDTEENEE